jgi:hypothetical protein
MKRHFREIYHPQAAPEMSFIFFLKLILTEKIFFTNLTA